MVRNTRSSSSGQVLLIVVITMIVVLTIGLTLASRTITNLKLSKQNEDSQRAFQAASAGIDRYINQSSGGTNNLNNASFTTSITNLQGNASQNYITLLNNGDLVDQDRGIEVWLSDYPSFANPISGSIFPQWGTSNQSSCNTGSGKQTTPAVEIVVLSGNINSPTMAKYLFDPCASRRASNNFSTPSSPGNTFNGITLSYYAGIPISSGLLMKIIPLYNSSVLGVTFVPSSGQPLPPQGKVITSTGISGDITRKVVYFESYPQIPDEVFPYAILSQ